MANPRPKKKTLKLTITVTEEGVTQPDGTVNTTVNFAFTPFLDENEPSVRRAICMAAVQGVQRFFDDQKTIPTDLKLKPKKGGR